MHTQAGPYRVRIAAADLVAKAFTPMFIDLSARSLEEHGPFRRTPGEMFVFALEGIVLVCFDEFEMLTLDKGDSVFFDGARAHALLAGGDPARALRGLSGEGPFWA
jgi:hypothetical protein